MSKIVLLGFEAYWFFAASPTNRSSSLKATYEGVIRFPWSFTKISTFPFCITPTQLIIGQRQHSTEAEAKRFEERTNRWFLNQCQ